MGPPRPCGPSVKGGAARSQGTTHNFLPSTGAEGRNDVMYGDALRGFGSRLRI
jgi:hypothetical protein